MLPLKQNESAMQEVAGAGSESGNQETRTKQQFFLSFQWPWECHFKFDGRRVPHAQNEIWWCAFAFFDSWTIIRSPRADVVSCDNLPQRLLRVKVQARVSGDKETHAKIRGKYSVWVGKFHAEPGQLSCLEPTRPARAGLLCPCCPGWQWFMLWWHKSAINLGC